jgi:2,4-dienoyl-CoA reductase-like NADH-dependent reductase (Old Yellow Enzyme family)/thioredoxin reductase
MAPMEKNYCTRDGRITQRYIDYLVARARGGVALLRAEATYVEPAGKGRKFQLGAHGDHVTPGLRALVDAIHEAGGRISFELCHSGRQTNSNVSGFQPVAPSPVTCAVSGGFLPREASTNDITTTVAAFANAAARCDEAGCDAIEIHGASGYLVNAFLSRFSNRRTDAYGGSLENRMRFPLEVVRAVRGAVDPRKPLLYRLCAVEFVDDGLTLEETVPFAQRLQEMGVDLIDVSTGIYESVAKTIPPMEAQAAEAADFASQLRAHLEIPVSVAGKLGDLKVAEDLLAGGKVDFVTIARGLHADPQLLVKAAAGALDEVVRCISCSECSNYLASHGPAYCAVNPETGRERELQPRAARIRKRVVVIGAGPAGLEAARRATILGHDVTVIEKDEEAGGQTRLGGLVAGRQPFSLSSERLAHQLRKLGVEVQYELCATTLAVIALKPDAVMVATGARPVIPPIPGVTGDNVRTAFDVLAQRRREGATSALGSSEEPVVIVGGTWIACHVADAFLAAGIEQVTIVTLGEALAPDMGPRPGMVLRERLASNSRFQMVDQATVEGIDNEWVYIARRDARGATRLPAKWVVVGTELEPSSELADELALTGEIEQLCRIGDCVAPRKLQDALLEAARAAIAL